MPSFLVETYLAHGAAGERQMRDRRAREAAAALTSQGTPVVFRGSIHVPEDELCLFAFEAQTGTDAALAADQAGLTPLRVIRAVSTVDE